MVYQTTYLTTEDCQTILQAQHSVSLSCYSENGGPYVIRVGLVPVGAFGFCLEREIHGPISSQTQLINDHALEVAQIAFKLIMQKLNPDEDPSRTRQMARLACRHARFNFLTMVRQGTQSLKHHKSQSK